jgi:hypothetical protein
VRVAVLGRCGGPPSTQPAVTGAKGRRSRRPRGLPAGAVKRGHAKEPQPVVAGQGSFTMYVRRRPTLPHRHQCSTIGAEGLSFRVRNGAGRFPFAMTAVTLGRYPLGHDKLIQRSVFCCACVPDRISGTAQWTRSNAIESYCVQVIGLLVPVSFTPYGASTSGLSTQWSCWEPLTPKGHGNLILKRASRLDAFSGYHFRT